MYVKSLDLLNFRNYRRLSFEPGRGINILFGGNAQGKTNILEAVYLAGTTKSHRGSRDRDVIMMGEEESHIRMISDRRGNEYRIDVHLRKNRGKGYAVGGVPIKKAADLYGIVSIVFFSPEDLGIIKNGPAGRRRFIDLLLCSTDRVYLSDLAVYMRTLNQRNALLKAMAAENSGEARLDELSLWDEQLAASGSRIIEQRRRFTENFRNTASSKHGTLTGGKEILDIIYEPCVRAEDFMKRLLKNRDYDMKMKTTSVGPHRDDMAVLANGMDLRTFGSQGQQRTAALSMKLAEIETVYEEMHEMPVLLLDDVFSELDRERQDALLSSMGRTQTLITCTGMDEYIREKIEADRVFYVKEGAVYEY